MTAGFDVTVEGVSDPDSRDAGKCSERSSGFRSGSCIVASSTRSLRNDAFRFDRKAAVVLKLMDVVPVLAGGFDIYRRLDGQPLRLVHRLKMLRGISNDGL